MNEKILNEVLGRAIRKGDVELELDDMMVDSLLKQPWPELPTLVKREVKEKFRVRLQDVAIARAKETVSAKRLSFGRFLEAVRTKANLSKMDVGVRLQKSDEYVQRLERGDLNPAELPARELADIVEVFRLVLTTVAEMILASIETMNMKQTIRASARSHGGIGHDIRGEDVERALDAIARKLASKSSKVNVESKQLESCMTNLREELQRRGRMELLE